LVLSCYSSIEGKVFPLIEWAMYIPIYSKITTRLGGKKGGGKGIEEVVHKKTPFSLLVSESSVEK
jgi:hypothetical protein